MTAIATRLPARRSDLVIRPIGEEGRYVVKLPGTHDYFHLGEEEHFLLRQLDGEQEAEEVCAAFEARFGEALSVDELDGFIGIARERRLLEPNGGRESADASSKAEVKGGGGLQAQTSIPGSQRQSILYWRKSVFDPDQFFNSLEPKIRFFWTRAFLAFSAGCVLLAVLILWTGRQAVATSFVHALRWETLVLAWLVMFAIGMLHESAHGLTCKHYGGEVHEIGFLLMYFMPCFYCNVSDAWLFREKSKRLWVTFAGGYFELFLWALAVFVWRVTVPDSLPNYLAFIVVVSCGVDSLFNFNPLIKLDGYYLLSDWTEIPNLRQRSLEHAMGRVRRLLWGGPKPTVHPRGKFLLGFGLTSWVYSLTFIVLMLIALSYWLKASLGAMAFPLVGILGIVSTRSLWGALFREEFVTMIWQRTRRTVLWGLFLAGLVGASLIIPWTETASGEFEVRAEKHVELRAPVAGFLQHAYADQGQYVPEAHEIARFSIPDLESRHAQKQAALHEAEAKLRLLKARPRTEEVLQQKNRVAAVETWRDNATRTLLRQREVLEKQLSRFDKLLQESAAECDFAQQQLAVQEKLRSRNVASEMEYLAVKKSFLIACAKRDQTQAEQESLAAQGTLAAESELAEREKELAHEQAHLALLLAGTQKEEIEAAEASVARLREELFYLENLRERTIIRSPIAGVITTERLPQKVGDYFQEGELLCEIEEGKQLEILIALDEDQAAQVRPGQSVRLKARSLPFEVFEVEVDRIAPRATTGEVQSQVSVYCQLNDPYGKFRSGMTGYARVHCHAESLGSVLYKKVLRFIRTEFWW